MNNVANINDVSNSVKAMPLISHSGAAVVTTDMLADVYGTEVINIQVNHSRNKDRFVEGKHFYKLTGSILKEFKNWLTKSKLVYKGSEVISKHAKSIILWTERGAARHAKMLDTDNAWDVFEALEDFYFAKKQEPQHKSTVQERNPLKNAVNLLVSKKGIMYPEAYSLVHQQFNVSGIDELTADQIPMAVEYVHKLVMEGEYIPKEDPRETTHLYVNKDINVHNINALAKHFEVIYTAWKVEIYPALRSVDSPIAGRLYDRFQDGYSFLMRLQESINGKHPALIK
ncbi:ORF6N domain-containing protein [Providencia huaxiensis]|uniref:ORF6N domain-containing protein n=1 Tax=Providencia huaxiensis TaxID=2027290 RepID=UPI0034DD37AB